MTIIHPTDRCPHCDEQLTEKATSVDSIQQVTVEFECPEDCGYVLEVEFNPVYQSVEEEGEKPRRCSECDCVLDDDEQDTCSFCPEDEEAA
jgi:hypothetical protein